MRRLATMALTALGAAVVGVALAACGGGAPKPPPSVAPSPVLRAPAATAARAAAQARAALGGVRLPRGSVRVGAPRGGFLAALHGLSFSRPYRTFKTATEYWALPSAGAVVALLRRPPRPSARWGPDGSFATQGVQIALAPIGRWLGPRWVVLSAARDARAPGRWLAMVEATVVWTPWRLALPSGVRSVTVRRAQDGALLARVGDPRTVARIRDAVDALAVDDAVRAVYHCPMIRAGVMAGIELSFAGASGAVLARAATEGCLADLALSVRGGLGQQLILDGLLTRLGAILGRPLPASR